MTMNEAARVPHGPSSVVKLGVNVDRRGSALRAVGRCARRRVRVTQSSIGCYTLHTIRSTQYVGTRDPLLVRVPSRVRAAKCYQSRVIS